MSGIRGDKLQVDIPGVGLVEIPRGDMSPEDWVRLEVKTKNDHTFRGKTESREADGQLTKDSGERLPHEDYIELNMGKGAKGYLPRGDMDQKSWDSVKAMVKNGNMYSGSYETAAPEPELTDVTVEKKPGEKRQKEAERQLQVGPDRGVQSHGKFGPIGQAINAMVLKAAPSEGQHPGQPDVPQAPTIGPQDTPPQPSGASTMGAPVSDNARQTAGETIGDVARLGASTLIPALGPSTWLMNQDAKASHTGPTGIPEAIGNGISQAVNVAGHALAPDMVPQQNFFGPSAPASGDAPSANPTTGVPSPAPSSAEGGAGAVSVSASGLPAGVGGASFGKMRDLQKQIGLESEAAQKAARDVGDAQAYSLAQQARVQEEGVLQQQMIQKRHEDAQRQIQAEVQKGVENYNSVLNELNNPARTVDPNRYWKQRTTGQRVMMSLGAALMSGDTGLRMMQEAVRDDIEAQKFDLSNDRARLSQKLSGAQTLYGMMRDKGLDEFAAYKGAMAASYDMLAQQLEAVKLNTGSDIVRKNADAAAQKIKSEGLKEQFGMEQHIQGLAIQNAHLQLQKEALAIKMQTKAGATGKGMANQLAEMADMDSMLGQIKGLRQQYPMVQGFTNKLLALDPTGTTNAAQFNAKRVAVINLLTYALSGKAINKEEMVRFEQMLPPAGAMEKGAVALDSLIKTLQKKLDTRKEMFRKSGYAVPDTSEDEDLGIEPME